MTRVSHTLLSFRSNPLIEVLKLLLGSIRVTPTTYAVASVTAAYSVFSISCIYEVSVYRVSYLGPGFDLLTDLVGTAVLVFGPVYCFRV